MDVRIIDYQDVVGMAESEKYLIDNNEEFDLKSGHSWVIFSIK